MDPFPALAEPSRRRMMELLGDGERAAGAIASEFDLTAAAVSQHLRVLREAKLVRVRIEGPRRVYSLDPEGLAAVDAWLGKVRGFWGARLDDLERAIEEEKETGE
jgi:DNA-binding transcriptional ArsR family regulator